MREGKNGEGGKGKEKGKEPYSDTEFFGKGIDFCVFQQLGPVLVDGGRGGIRREGAVGEFGGEVFACVEVFEEAAHRFEVGVGEIDAAALDRSHYRLANYAFDFFSR